MAKKNPEKLNQIISYINNEYEKNGRTPSYRDLSKHFNISLSTVHYHINNMKENGMLKINDGSHAIITKKMEKNISTTNIAVVGTISCGMPILAEENIESYISLPSSYLGNGTFFVLKAQGDSMINVGINDGDYVIVRQQDDAEQGQIVVALVENEATLKRYYIDNKRKQVRLHPENDNMEDMFFDNIKIQGVAVKVLKDLF